MRSNQVIFLLAAACAFSANAQAEGLDGSSPLVCDFAEAAQCDGVAECDDVRVEQIGLPASFHVDFSERRISTPGDARTTPIGATETLEELLLLQGNQNGRGWTLVIERATGHLSAAVADAEGAFVLAGACTTR